MKIITNNFTFSPYIHNYHLHYIFCGHKFFLFLNRFINFLFLKKKKINFFACLRAALRFLCINPFQFLKPNHEVAQLSVMRSDICFCSNYAPRQAAAWGTQKGHEF